MKKRADAYYVTAANAANAAQEGVILVRLGPAPPGDMGRPAGCACRRGELAGVRCRSR
jgi:hypothetical protein